MHTSPMQTHTKPSQFKQLSTRQREQAIIKPEATTTRLTLSSKLLSQLLETLREEVRRLSHADLFGLPFGHVRLLIVRESLSSVPLLLKALNPFIQGCELCFSLKKSLLRFFNLARNVACSHFGQTHVREVTDLLICCKIALIKCLFLETLVQPKHRLHNPGHKVILL